MFFLWVQSSFWNQCEHSKLEKCIGSLGRKKSECAQFVSFAKDAHEPLQKWDAKCPKCYLMVKLGHFCKLGLFNQD